MGKIIKKISSHNWLARWYFGFFMVVVFSFVALVYFYVSKQTWQTFDYKISLLGEEMLEEINTFRESINVEPGDSIQWTANKLEKISQEIEQEMINETMDNDLEDVGFVHVENLVTGRLIYKSPKIMERGIKYKEAFNQYQGYQPFTYESSYGRKLMGVGYFYLRLEIYLYVAVVSQNSRPVIEKLQGQSFKNLAYKIVESIERKADVLYVKDSLEISRQLEFEDAIAYVYICENDSLLWTSKTVKKSDIYVPENIGRKEYYWTIKDNQNQKYRQYALIHDIFPKYGYLFNLVIPIQEIRRSLNSLLFFLLLGALALIGIVWGGGHLITRHALKPVDEIIRSVKEITTKNLDKRLPVPDLEQEIVRLVHTFNELLDRLAISFKMQKSFIADASHELRTPLSILMSDIETALKDTKHNSTASKSLINAIDEIDRMARIVDDLYWLAKSDTGQLYANNQIIRLDDVLMSTLSRCQVLANQRNIKLSVEKMDIIEMRGDEELLIRAFSNVVNNAIKYSYSKGNVKLSLSSLNSSANFVVQDFGIGIPNKSISKIFDRFYRVDSSRSRETGGSGLGLAITKWICEIHRGTIKVSSEINKGSNFTIELPIAPT
jgi:signal transduction histidine kinase